MTNTIETKKEPRTINHSYKNTPFAIKATEKESEPGCWNVWLVEILKDGQKIGEYTRGYSRYVLKTFHPFLHKGKWYALYSSSYTKTSIARLEDDNGNPLFEPWCDGKGGEGFCPTDFYVPYGKVTKQKYVSKNHSQSTKEKTVFEYSDSTFVTWDNDKEYDDEPLSQIGEVLPLTEENYLKDYVCEAGVQYADFGFLCGCVWGDDSSWKVRFIDFTDLVFKDVKITERFGYFELANDLNLKESIVLSESSMNGKYIGIKTVVKFIGDKTEEEYYNQKDSETDDD